MRHRNGWGVLTGLIMGTALAWSLADSLAGPGLADETTDKLAEVEQRAAASERYRAEFTLTVVEQGQATILAGQILYQRPDKRRIEFNNIPGVEDVAQVIVSDGTSEWQYFPRRRIVQKTEWARLQSAGIPAEALAVRGPHQPFVDVRRETIRYVGIRKDQEPAVYLFEAEPSAPLVAEAPFEPGKFRVEVAPEDGLVRRLTMTDAEGREVLRQEYTKIERDAAIGADAFSFTIPDGVEVVDITEDRIQAAAPAAPTPSAGGP